MPKTWDVAGNGIPLENSGFFSEKKATDFLGSCFFWGISHVTWLGGFERPVGLQWLQKDGQNDGQNSCPARDDAPLGAGKVRAAATIAWRMLPATARSLGFTGSLNCQE